MVLWRLPTMASVTLGRTATEVCHQVGRGQSRRAAHPRGSVIATDVGAPDWPALLVVGNVEAFVDGGFPHVPYPRRVEHGRDEVHGALAITYDGVRYPRPH